MKQAIRKFLALDLGTIVGHVLRFLTILSVAVLGIVSWKDAFSVDFGSWDSIRESAASGWAWLVVVLFATLLAAFDPGGRILRARKAGSAAITRMTNLCEGVERVAPDVKAKKDTDLQGFYERILRAAEADLELALGQSTRDVIKTNLLILSDPDRIKVTARSRPGSPVGHTYDCDDKMLCEKSMGQNRTLVLAVRNGEGREGQVYKEVVATPIVWQEKAYGAITADAAHLGIFRKRADLVDQVLRPYASLVMLVLDLTGDPGAPYRPSQPAYWR